MGSRRELVAGRRDGCFICSAWSDVVISLGDQGVIVCRPCVTRVSDAILGGSAPLLARLWPEAAPVTERRPSTPATDGDVDPIFEGFKTGLEAQIEGDAVAHFDLAVAYGEMGLTADALREAAKALGARAPVEFTTRVMTWLFAQERARPDALATIATVLRQG